MSDKTWMPCKTCNDVGYIDMELLPGLGEYHSPDGRDEEPCPLCNWRPSQDMPDAVADLHDAAAEAEIEAQVDQMWVEYEAAQAHGTRMVAA